MNQNSGTDLIYFRPHIVLDEAIRKEAKEKHITRSTMARIIIEDYVDALMKRCNNDIRVVTKDDLRFSSLSSSFICRRGRASKSMLAKPMNITLSVECAETVKVLSMKFGHGFITSIFATHYHDVL